MYNIEIMTNEIAFNIGAFKYPSFYDYAVRYEHDLDFEYINFFNWSNNTTAGYLYGSLKEEMFLDIEHKHHYLQGTISIYGHRESNNVISVTYANSFSSRDRFVKWALEIIRDKFFEFNMYNKLLNYKIIIFDGPSTMIPSVPGLIIGANDDVIKYLLGKEKFLEE